MEGGLRSRRLMFYARTTGLASWAVLDRSLSLSAFRYERFSLQMNSLPNSMRKKVKYLNSL
jgi:hypothetical protein